jgi:2',3'-cyclic-nucleotide 2'-phosphodiesterase (5'-nucleotidase family)
VNTKRLTILQINDLHGYIEPHAELVRSAGGLEPKTMGGLARIAALFSQISEENPGAVLALDNGDTFHGTFVAVESRGRAMVPMMNALGLAAMTAHWEFAYGPADFKALTQQLIYPMLAINCFREANDELFFAPMTIVQRGGLKIGVIGIACPIVGKTMPPDFSKGVRFTIGDKELPHWIARARSEGAELIVVLSHLGFPQDVKLAQNVDGIDVIVSGHTHNRMENAITVNGAIIFQSGCHGSFIGRLDLEVFEGQVAAHHHQLIAIHDTLPEAVEVREMADNALKPHREALATVVGRTDVLLHRYDMLNSSMDNLLLRAVSEASGCEVAFSNGWRYGAPILPGPITLNDLWNIVPTNPPISTVVLSGQEIWDMLEENLERTFAANPYEQMGGYVKRCLGLQLYFKAENPKFHRIDRLFVCGEEVAPQRDYQVSFITAQGVPLKYGRERKSLDIRAVDALKTYLASGADQSLHDVKSVFEV